MTRHSRGQLWRCLPSWGAWGELQRRLGALALSLGSLLWALPAQAAKISVAPPAKPWVGIMMKASPLGGVLVLEVFPASPAEIAGLKKGDRLLSLDATPVRTPHDVVRLVALRTPGDRLSVRLVRTAAVLPVTVVLGPKPTTQQLLRSIFVGRRAPDFTMTLLDGSAARLSRLRGRVVLLEFISVSCPACRTAVPRVNALQAKYGAKGLTALAVAAQPWTYLKTGLGTWGSKYMNGAVSPVVSGIYKVMALPTFFLIDKRGYIRDVEVGYRYQLMHMEMGIKKLISGKALSSQPPTSPAPPQPF